MRILITTFGSLGDLFPYLNIARHLTGAGHEVTVAANWQHREQVEAQGLRFHAVRPEIQPDALFFERAMSEFSGPRFLLRDVLFPAIRDSYQDLQAALTGHDTLITHPATFAGPLVAKATGIPWISSVLAPISFFSATDPPVVSTRLAGLRKRAPWLSAAINHFAKRTTRPWGAPVFALARELGLESVTDPLFEGQHSPKRVLALFSKHFAAPQTDWPEQAEVTGFPLAAPAALPPAIERFLAAGPPPIVFTLGSSAVFVPGRFFEAAKTLGKRAILLAGPAASEVASTNSLLAVEYAPHSALFPHAAVVVHQGGIGTTAEVLRSGKPSLVVPFAHDQPDNAARLERLGLARVLSRRSLNGENLRNELSRLMEDSRYRERAADFARLVQAEDGAKTSALRIAATDVPAMTR